MLLTAPIDAQSDLSRLQLGDARLNRRARSIAGALQARPSESFPKALADDAAVEGFYRFMVNDRVNGEAVLGAHVDATHDRAVQVGAQPGTPRQLAVPVRWRTDPRRSLPHSQGQERLPGAHLPCRLR